MPLENDVGHPDAGEQGFNNDLGGHSEAFGGAVGAVPGGLFRGVLNQFQSPTPQEAQNSYGGSAGYLGQAQAYARGQAIGAEGRGAAPMDFSTANQAYGQQQGLAGQYNRIINGQGPTVAGQQMQLGQAQASQALANQALSARGGADNQAMAMRNAQQMGTQQMAQNNMQSSMLRAGEVANAMGGQAGLLGNMQQGQMQQTNLQAQNEEAQRKMNDQQSQFYEKNLTDMNSADLQAKTGITTANAGIQSAKSGNILGGGVMGIVGGILLWAPWSITRKYLALSRSWVRTVRFRSL